MNFSVLISVYREEESDYFKASLKSIWDNQSLKPSEIVIVKDGPLTEQLDIIIDNFAQKAPVHIISLKNNSGLGVALAKGLLTCKNETIARMDSDDISTPDRFKKQIEYLKNHPDISLLGSNIAEFIKTPSLVCGIRKVPEKHEDIFRFAKKRNPMNHVSIIFKKSAVLNSGNYLTFIGYEDYYLWVRMFLKGYRAANIQENLVYVRIGNNMIKRRQGLKFFKRELMLQKRFYSMNFISAPRYIKNIFLRGLPRLMPVLFLSYIYKYLRKKN